MVENLAFKILPQNFKYLLTIMTFTYIISLNLHNNLLQYYCLYFIYPVTDLTVNSHIVRARNSNTSSKEIAYA